MLHLMLHGFQSMMTGERLANIKENHIQLSKQKEKKKTWKKGIVVGFVNARLGITDWFSLKSQKSLLLLLSSFSAPNPKFPLQTTAQVFPDLMPDNEMERPLKNCTQSSSQLSLQVRCNPQLAKPPIFNDYEQWTKWGSLSTSITSLFQSYNIFCFVQQLPVR